MAGRYYFRYIYGCLLTIANLAIVGKCCHFFASCAGWHVKTIVNRVQTLTPRLVCLGGHRTAGLFRVLK